MQLRFSNRVRPTERPRLTRRRVFAGALVVFLGLVVSARVFVPSGGADVAPVPLIEEAAAADEWLVMRRVGGQLRLDTYAAGEIGVGDAYAMAAAVSEIVSIERDGRVELFDDFYRPLQWHLDAVAYESINGTYDGSGVKVAIVDTSIALGHEDLDGFVPGWDSIENRPLEAAHWITADADHGTHVAGVLAAVPDNDVGGAGVAPGVELMPIRALKANGGFVSDVIEGVLWAISHDADIINLSLGTANQSAALTAAIAEAEAQGIVVIAASGNNGLAGDPVRYPAALDTVIAVGATGVDGVHWPQSSRSPTLDVVAPGEDIMSLAGSATDAYRQMSGTSMATPQVAGTVAILLQADPTLTPAQIRTLLRSTADDLGVVGHDPEYGYGLLDPVEALAAVDGDLEIVVPPAPPTGLSARNVEGGIALAWRPLGEGVDTVTIERDGQLIATLGPQAASYTDTDAVAGAVHVYTVTANGVGGAAWSTVSVSVDERTIAYWIATNTGRVVPFGGAERFEAASASAIDVIAGTSTTTGRGYWLVDGTGTVIAHGDAAHHGDLAALPLNEPVVGMAATPSGGGYWLVARDGGVFAFGDATFFGSMGGIPLNGPIVDMAVSDGGRGYWLAASDGGVFAFGDAPFRGSTGAITLNESIVSITSGVDGYWMVARDGGVFTFGVSFLGSLPGLVLEQSALADGLRIRSIDEGAGYLVLTADGALFGFGSAASLGSAGIQLLPGERAVDLLLLGN